MIITLQTAQFIITIVSLLMAYFITITISNYVKARVALTFGDDTPEQLGFLTLNPLAHIDPIGLLFVCLFQFGWARYIPINPLNMRSPHRTLKTIITFLSNSFACIVLALAALIGLMLIFNDKIINIACFMILYQKLSYMIIASAYPTHSSVTVAIGTILIGIMYLSVVLSVLQAIINGVSLVMLFNSHRMNYHNIDKIMLTALLILFVVLPLLGILDIVSLLRLFVVYIIAFSGHALAALIG